MGQEQPYRLIISGGGTGGHIFPAVAIANEFRSRYPDSEILFVGAEGKMEMTRVPEAGYKIVGLWISGLQRKLTLSNLLFPVKLLTSYFRAVRLLKQFKPHAVVGTGGYARSRHDPPRRVRNSPLSERIRMRVYKQHCAKPVRSVCYEGMEKYSF